jgi:hypothetical protein
VRIDRPVGGHWTAEQLVEVPVKGFAIDCSSLGEPFCVVFWPDFGEAVEGCQLEVELSGLRGDRTKLNFFYEFKNFMQKLLDQHLCAEAASFRTFIGDHVFWGPPREPVLVTANDMLENRTTSKLKKQVVARLAEKYPIINIISYQETSFSTNCVDVTLVLQSDEVVAIFAELKLVRFSGEEDEVPCGATVQKLPAGNYFLVRAKLPMSRQRFEIRFFASVASSPDEFKKHPLRYLITTGKECQSLLSTLEDPRRKKFGYCQIDATAQQSGIVVISPVTRRLSTGSIYFLVYVDKSVALAYAKAELEKVYHDAWLISISEGLEAGPKGRSSSKRRSIEAHRSTNAPFASNVGGRNMRLFTHRIQVQDIPDESLCKAAQAVQSAVKRSAEEMDIVEWTPPPSRKGFRKSIAAIKVHENPATADPEQRKKDSTKKKDSTSSDGQAATVLNLQSNLRAILEKHTQDACADVTFDVSLRGGEVLYRLRERTDLPGFFEGLFSFNDQDIGQKVELYYRFPWLHAVEYSPRKLGDWCVVRDEPLPQNF